MAIALLHVIIIIYSLYALYFLIDKFFIRALDSISDFFKMGPIVSGATLMAFATSAPELSITLISVLNPNFSIETGIGSIVGSLLFQFLLVTGTAGIIRPFKLEVRNLFRDLLFYEIAIILFIYVLLDNVVTLRETLLLLSVYPIYLFVIFKFRKFFKQDEFKRKTDALDIVEDAITHTNFKRIKRLSDLVFYPINKLSGALNRLNFDNFYISGIGFIVSIAVVGVISYFLVNSSESLANILGVSPFITSLTILAWGSSFPELFASSILSKTKRGNMAVSNAIGSNIFDTLISFGLPMFIAVLIGGNIVFTRTHNVMYFVLISSLVAFLFGTLFFRFKMNKSFGILLYATFFIASGVMIFLSS